MMGVALSRPDPFPETLVEGEYPLTAADFERIRALLHADSGIHLPETKATLVYSRLAKRLRRLGLQSFSDYCAMIAGPEGGEERRNMLAALTTNVTRFFREPHHYDHLLQALEPLAARARAGGRVRLWSAGCSSGQEPYSIAMTLLDVLPEAASLDVRILATDIDPVILAQAREGAYSEEALDGVSAERRNRWMRRGERGWKVGEELRRLIVFNELNLMNAWPIRNPFQIIFCRNVCIYFEAATQERLWSRFADALTPDGRLYIGHSERAMEPRLVSDGLTVYRLRGASR